MQLSCTVSIVGQLCLFHLILFLLSNSAKTFLQVYQLCFPQLSLQSQMLPPLKALGRGKRGWQFRVPEMVRSQSLYKLSVVFSSSIHDNSVFSHKYLQVCVCFCTSAFVCLLHWLAASLLNTEGNFKKTYCHIYTGWFLQAIWFFNPAAFYSSLQAVMCFII